MRTLRSLAFLAALLPGIVAAQLPYPNIGPNTIVGRIGTTTGPAFAIPFSTLVAQMGAVPTSRIINTTAPLAGGGNLNTDLTLTFAAQAPNVIFAGPTSGGSVVPSFRAMVAADISASIVSNAKLANAPAYTLKGNATNASATPTDIDITALTSKGSPVSGDIILIQDSAASFAMKKATVGSVASAGSVSSIDAKTGTFTTGNGLDSTGGNVIELTAARRTLPDRQLLTASSGTYTTPANALWVEFYMVGGSGGGGGTGSAGGTGAGGAGGNTCLNTSGSACSTPVYQATGGSGGAVGSTTTSANGGLGGTGGTSGGGSSTPDVSSNGADGNWGSPGTAGTFTGRGGKGGVTQCGPILLAGGDGGSGITGGGGGGGGGGPACTYTIITSPAASYTFTNGAAGTAGPSGTGGNAGLIGLAGKILAIAHFGT